MNMKDKYQQITEAVISHFPARLNGLLAPEAIDCSEDTQMSRVRFTAKEWEKNQRGELHGGAAASMFDTCIGITAAAFADSNVTTADLSVSYIRPFIGSSYIFESKVVHLGRTLIRIEGKAFDESSGKLLASAQGMFVRIEGAI